MAAVATKQGPTLLGTQVRRMMVGAIRGFGRGVIGKVVFRGTRAYTNGRDVHVPAIKDLAEIPYETARALIGYAIHEVAHIRYTDFTQSARAMSHGKRVKHFENAIEDYRIEREMTRDYVGSKSDLIALRIAIHPEVNKLKPSWYADPRRCGALALTWTGSQLNGFPNPKISASLAAMPGPVRALIMDWTRRMKDVASTSEAVDLAIQFVAEADEYARLTQEEPGEGGGSGDGDPSDKRGEPGDADSDSPPPPTDDDQSEADRDEDDRDEHEDDDLDDGSDDQDSDEEDQDKDPFSDALNDDAQLDDIIDDIADAIREQDALPDVDDDDTVDGEVDPTEVVKAIAKANAAAPNYTTSAGTDEGDDQVPSASKNHYDDTRFSVLEPEGDASAYDELRGKAAGAIMNTARTVKRLLMSESQSGVARNKRAGDFDIRNMSAIIRNTGTCYKRAWHKPSPTTHVAVLADFSGSMDSGRDRDGRPAPIPPVDLAMMSLLTIEQATLGTPVTTSLYAYTGYSPHVNMTILKEGNEQAAVVRRRIGAYREISKNCTPTGEAIAALAMRMEQATEDRKVLVVLTDGAADDQALAAEACRVLMRRGIEVIAIGINSDTVAGWAPVHHVIYDIADLPQALLETIDPRNATGAGRQAMRQAA